MLTSIITPKIYNTILISPSIMSFYLIPIFFILFLNKINKINFKDKYNILGIIFITILITLVSAIFDYDPKVGGGFFIKLSILFFDNNILGILTSIIGLFLLFYLSREHKDNLVIVILLVFAFPAYWIFQKG